MRFLRFALLGAALGLTAGCSEPGDDPTSPNIPPLAHVRYINAVPDTLNTTVRFIDQVQYSPMTFVNVAFRSLGGGSYQPTAAGARKLRVFTADAVNFSTAGNTQILVDTTLTFEAGKYYTLLHMGYARPGSSPKQRLVAITDVAPTLGTNVSLRTINAALGLGAVDVYKGATATSPIAGAPLFPALATEAISAYQSFTPGAFAAQVARVGTTTALAAAAAPAGTAGTTTVDPIGGATIAGSVITAIAFPASTTGSSARAFPAPGVVYFIDKHPPRTTPNP